jgi:hypothetical protein
MQNMPIVADRLYTITMYALARVVVLAREKA